MSRALGLALMAALALTALVASAAQAAPEFHSETASSTMPAEIKGEQEGVQEFSTVNGTVKCNVAKFNGTSTATATTSQTLAPTYEGCTAFGEAANVNPNGCTYTFNLVKSSSPATANANVNCAAGKAITVTAFAGCTTTVGAQTGKPHIVFENTNIIWRFIMAKVTLSSITYTASGCLFNGTFNTGTVNGNANILGYTEGAQQGIWVE